MRAFKLAGFGLLALLLSAEYVNAQQDGEQQEDPAGQPAGDENENENEGELEELPQKWVDILAQNRLDPSTYQSGVEEKATSTRIFSMEPGTYRENIPLDERMTGLLVGFICTAIFLVAAAILILYDEIKRHETYSKLIDRDLEKFRDDWKYTA